MQDRFATLSLILSLLPSTLTVAPFENDHPICLTYCGEQCKNYYRRGMEWEWVDCILSRVYCKCFNRSSSNTTDKNTLFDILMVAPGIVLICLLLCCCYCKIKSMPKNLYTKSTPWNDLEDRATSCNEQAQCKNASKTLPTTGNPAHGNHSPPVIPTKLTNQGSEIPPHSGCVVDISCVESTTEKTAGGTTEPVSLKSNKQIAAVE